MGQRGPISQKGIQAARTSGSLPTMPRGLSEDAKAEWKRITGLLDSRNLLDALDQVALGDYICCWSRLRECEAEISRLGVVIVGERGRVKNPACQLARQYRDHLIQWSKEFGLTVGSRARMSLKQPEPEMDSLEAILFSPRIPNGRQA